MANFDKMVDYFDQKKIRDLASEHQYKRPLRNYSLIRNELKKALLYIHRLKLHTSDVIGWIHSLSY